MVSQNRDVRTGEPVWNAYRRPRIVTEALSSRTDTDILIIGAGVSGAMIAEALSGHGLDVLVVDKRKPLSGATSASTALLQYEIDTPLIQLEKKIGRSDAVAAWRRSKLGVESLAAKIKDLAIDCAIGQPPF
jgi:glycine/D-amino acid oxidase-like deaminating enzyme